MARGDTRFLNFVDTPAVVQYSQFSEASVILDPATGNAVVDVTPFHRVSVLIGSTSATSFEVHIGKIKGSTLAQAFSGPINGQIHTYDVVGPQLSLWLRGGAPNSQESVQLWVYLAT
jgi:hypothetical protein